LAIVAYTHLAKEYINTYTGSERCSVAHIENQTSRVNSCQHKSQQSVLVHSTCVLEMGKNPKFWARYRFGLSVVVSTS